MSPVLHITGRLLLNGLAGLCCLAALAMAADSPAPAKNRQNSVIVYSRADMQSNGVTTLTRNDTFHIRAELWNGSRRWCAINSRNNQFMGYALCDQLENMKKGPADDRRSRHAAARTERRKAAGHNPADQVRRPAAPAPAALRTGPTAGTTAAATLPAAPAGGVARPGDAGPGGSASLIWLVFITVFLLTISSLCLLENRIMDIIGRRGERKGDKGTGTDRGDERQNGLEEGPNRADGTAVQEVIGLPPDSQEAGPAAADETVEYQFWDCVIRKADPAAMGRTVKCQICGSEQPLADDLKCTECGADMTYYIEIPEKQRS